MQYIRKQIGIVKMRTLIQARLSGVRSIAARMIVVFSIAAIALPAIGARRVTVAQLEEVVAADEDAHHADLEVARQIGELEMTEQLTGRTLVHFASIHKLGPRTALALQLLSDQSVFLDPPANELPATALPDPAMQQQMLEAARAYSVETWTRLPNFFVTRMTNRFDDAPHVLTKGDWPVRVGLQPVGTSSRQVTFRDGKEVQDPTSESAAENSKSSQELGLHSWGEFGPELTVVLADMAKHQVEFKHWEEIGTQLAAVYEYEVPKEASHYAVSYCCIFNQLVVGRTQFGYSGRNRSAQQVANIPRTELEHTYIETPGYHGTIAIDPATGAVLRITIQAELSHGDPLLLAETMVEYGTVSIGDRQFTCPLRSIAISMEQSWMEGAGNTKTVTVNGVGDDSAWQSPLNKGANAPIRLINETSFVDYHRLGSTARILTDAATAGAQSPPLPNSSGEASPPNSSTSSVSPGAGIVPPNPSADAAATAPPTAESGRAETQTANSAPPSGAIAPTATPPPPAEPAIPEVSMSAATGVPDQPTSAGEPTGEGYSLKVTSRLVDVGLVAYDKKGHPVTDLKAGDLEIYDNGRKQEIRSFGLAASPALAPSQEEPNPSSSTTDGAVPAVREASFANRAPDVSGNSAAPLASESGSTVLVIDESHIAWSDMSNTRAQILKFLGSLAPGERVGLYTMTGLGFHVLTEVTVDHAALIARMQKFMPSAQSLAEAQDEETRNRQHFDEVHNVADLNSVNGNHTDVPDAEQPVDPQLLTMGDNPARASFIILVQVARHLSSIPGPKKLVWVSSDNVLADWQDQSVGIDKSPRETASFALRAQEAMNEAHAAVYPFDVSQLEGGAITADLQHQNVQLTQASSDAESLGGGATASRSTGPGRIDAAMSQDLHPVQGTVRQVAAATGGRVIRRSGDLTAQLNGIVADEHATYMLSFSPQGPADGQYHTISLKLTGRHGLNLSYRTGYFFEKEPSTLKERFQQAVWRPMDVSEIAVTASVAPQGNGANVKVNIAAGDLGLQQQAGRWMDKLDIFFIQRDDAGLHARLEGQTLGLRLKSATYEKLMPTGVPFEHFVGAKQGMASLRVLVVDENSGRMGSVTIPVSAMGGRQ
jgi:VWFA-related protein